MRALQQVFGALLMLAILLDVFLTVLYARVGAGIVSQKLARLTWRLSAFSPLAAPVRWCCPSAGRPSLCCWS
jgi:hypothetical protein